MCLVPAYQVPTCLLPTLPIIVTYHDEAWYVSVTCCGRGPCTRLRRSKHHWVELQLIISRYPAEDSRLHQIPATG